MKIKGRKYKKGDVVVHNASGRKAVVLSVSDYGDGLEREIEICTDFGDFELVRINFAEGDLEAISNMDKCAQRPPFD